MTQESNILPQPPEEQSAVPTPSMEEVVPVEEVPAEEVNYFHHRVFEQMGLPPKLNKIKLQYDMGCDGRAGSGEFDIFSEDEKGNIRILVYTLKGWLVQYPDPNMGKTYDHSSITRMCTYYVRRIAPKNLVPDGPKYVFPKGQGTYPFFPPQLLDKFSRTEPINTLILTEGYFKAMTASLYGFDIVGLGSITLYADSKTHELYPDIKQIINTCKVQKVVLLYDGDCLNISDKDLEKKRDLARRPLVFYNSILNTRDLLIDFNVKIEFAHVKSDQLINNPKGLDDLLLEPAYRDKSADILNDLTEDANNSYFFYRMNVREQVKRLKQHFYLDSADNFYKHWADKIKEGEFIFEHMVYVYDSKEEKVQRAMPLAIRDFVRVGDDYYEMIQVPNIRSGIMERKLVPRKKGTIIDDFGKEQLKNIKKFKAFINKPSHIDYRPVVSDCFNLYSPLNYEAEPNCPWPHIDELLHHIFGEQYELGLDYMQLLYLQPMQILPILCLVSHERGTGKTSFLDLIREIFGANAIVVGNSEITSEFNALVSGKLVVGVDETSLEDNTKVTERLKMMSTAKRMPMQRKGKDHEEIENFTKYILCSNNETRFIYTQEDEVRFWVRKIEPIPDEKKIPNLLPILCEEIPGFLSFLLSRKMFVAESEDRMWFKAEMIETQALKDLKAAQQPMPVREIKESIRTLFMDFPSEEYIISIKVLKQMVEEIARMSNDSIRSYLRLNMNIPDALVNGMSKTVYVKIPYFWTNSDDRTQIGYHRDKGKGFVFKAKDFLNEKELEYVLHIVKTKKDAAKAEAEPPRQLPKEKDPELELDTEVKAPSVPHANE